MLKQAQSLPDSPDDLLRFCDTELQRLRTKRTGAQKHRAAVLAASIFLVVVGGMAAFFLLFTRLQEIRPVHAPVGVSKYPGDSLVPPPYETPSRP